MNFLKKFEIVKISIMNNLKISLNSLGHKMRMRFLNFDQTH